MTFRRIGFFPRFSRMLDAYDISVRDVVGATKLTEKSVRRMANNSGYSLYTSVERVVEFLNENGLQLKVVHEFVEAES